MAGAIWSPLLQNRSQVWRQKIYVGDWLPTLAAAAGIELDPKLKLDGINLWPELSSGITTTVSKNRAILHGMDDSVGITSYIKGEWKYIKGTIQNGTIDGVLTSRTGHHRDPREKRYAFEILKSIASKCLGKFDNHNVGRKLINELRSEAGIKCEYANDTKLSSCSGPKEECLFHIDNDPCEQKNLASSKQYTLLLEKMREDVDLLRKISLPPQNTPTLSKSNPKLHNCAWTFFLDEHPTTSIILFL